MLVTKSFAKLFSCGARSSQHLTQIGKVWGGLKNISYTGEAGSRVLQVQKLIISWLWVYMYTVLVGSQTRMAHTAISHFKGLCQFFSWKKWEEYYSSLFCPILTLGGMLFNLSFFSIPPSSREFKQQQWKHKNKHYLSRALLNHETAKRNTTTHWILTDKGWIWD